jgi:hypothetical protein
LVRRNAIGSGSELILRTGDLLFFAGITKTDPLDRNPKYRMFRASLEAEKGMTVSGRSLDL